MTLSELAISLNGCIDPDRGNGPEWDFIKAEGMLRAHVEDVVMTMMGAERIAVEAARRECADRALAHLARGEPGWLDDDARNKAFRAAIMGEE